MDYLLIKKDGQLAKITPDNLVGPVFKSCIITGCTGISQATIDTEVSVSEQPFLSYEISGDCFKICGCIQSASTIEEIVLATYGVTGTQPPKLRVTLDRFPVPTDKLIDTACSTGIWTCCIPADINNPPDSYITISGKILFEHIGSVDMLICTCFPDFSPNFMPPLNTMPFISFEACGQLRDDAFISVWDTTKDTPTDQITLPLNTVGGFGDAFNFTVDWGDGTQNLITSATQPEKTHVYNTPGIYVVTITGQIWGWRSGSISDSEKLKLIEIKRWGPNFRFSNFNGIQCYRCRNLVITAQDVPDTSNLTNTYRMFRECDSLVNIPNFGQWDMSNVTSMIEMFIFSTSFEGDGIGEWTTSSLQTCDTMCLVSSVDQDLSGWIISNLTSASNMFISNTLSSDNYRATLIGWAAQAPNIQNNVNFHAGNATYEIGGPSETAHDLLTGTPYSWIITDGGGI